MKPIHPSSSAQENFINPSQASDNTGSASHTKKELQNKAFAARDHAARLLNQGMNARLPKEKINLFLEARKVNQEAHETLAKNELSSGELNKHREENQRQGADIAQQLLSIRKKQFELEPRPEQKTQRQKDVLDEVELLDAHLQKTGSSNDIKVRIREISRYKAHLASDLSQKLRDESYQATGKEKIELLRSAKKYIDMAAHSMQQLRLIGHDLNNYRQMQRNSWTYAGHASDAAGDWMGELWRKYSDAAMEVYKYGHKMFLTSAAISGVNALHTQFLSCLEKNDYSLEIHQDLYDSCTELLSQTGACKRSVDEIKRLKESKDDAGHRIVIQALDRYFHGQLMLLLRLGPLITQTQHEALNVIVISAREMADANSITLGAFRALRVEVPSPPLMALRREVLPNLIEFSEDMSHRASWLLKACKSIGVKDEAIYSELQRSLDSSLHLQRALEKEYGNTRVIEPPKSGKSRLHKQFASLSLDQGGASGSEKGKSSESGSSPPAATDQGSEHRLIDTRFNGKLIGIPRGDKVVVKKFSGEEIQYRRDGEKWVRHEESTPDFDDIPTEEQSLRGQRDQAERTRLKISAMVTKTEGKVEELTHEALKNVSLSNFAAGKDAPFSQSIGIFNLAMDAHQKAMSMIGKNLKRIEQAVTSQPDLKVELKAYRDRLQVLLNDIENQNHTARKEKLEMIKSDPSGPGLDYLMDEKEVAAIRKTKTREERTGPNVPIGTQDFMDEYAIDIKGYGAWPSVHSHFRTKNGPIKSATAAHLTWETESGKIRLPVFIHLLERLEKASGQRA